MQLAPPPRFLRRVPPLLWLGVAAFGVRIPALLATRHLLFDDGVYGSAALAMRDGAVPFRDVFSPEGPLHLPQLWLFDWIGWHSLDGPRLMSVSSGLVVAIAVFFAARRLAGARPALFAAALATFSGSLLWVTGPITGDGPAVAWSCVAFAAVVACAHDCPPQPPPSARTSPTVASYCAARTCSAWRRLRNSLRRASRRSSWLTSPLR